MSSLPESNSILVRAMRLEDLAAVTAIDRASFTLPWPERAFRYELMENPHAQLWVAEMGALVVGLLVIWHILDESHIASIAVHPEYRRQGIGRKLLSAGLQAALERGSAQATLEVRTGNLAAIELYRQLHFEEVGRRPKYYQDTHEDAIIMTTPDLQAAFQASLNGDAPGSG